MSMGRIALIAAGVLIAAGALFLIVRGFSGAAASAATTVPGEEAAGAEGGGKKKDKDKAPPGWQSFIRPAERDTPPRPVVRFAQGLSNPFDRLPSASSGGGARRQENPGLRLEGISVGAQTVALLSGHAVREGDTVSGFRVVRIGRSAVTLAGPRGWLELGLSPAGGVGR